jgi:uncharacterized protein YecT (DUF1311 family)
MSDLKRSAKMKAISLFLLAAFAFCPARSEPVDFELAKLEAALQSANTQYEMNKASANIADYWDGRLLLIQSRIERKLQAEELKKFETSKKRWFRYRSEEVAFRDGLGEGGSMSPMLKSCHYAMLTKHRVIELESFWTDELSN